MKPRLSRLFSLRGTTGIVTGGSSGLGLAMTARLAEAGRKAKILARMPLHRLGRPNELAAAVVFLLSPAASYITGHDLAVDGGALAFGY